MVTVTNLQRNRRRRTTAANHQRPRLFTKLSARPKRGLVGREEEAALPLR